MEELKNEELKDAEEFTGLQKIQFELKAPKSQKNTFGKYNYRSCEDILEALKPLLQKYNCLLTLTDNIELIGDRYYVVATANFSDKNGQETESKSFARESASKKGMDESQITGAASSYARKYALNAMFLIDDVKDSDNTNTHGKDEDAKPPQQEQAIQKEQFKDFYKVWNGKLYGLSVYWNNVKYSVTQDQAVWLRTQSKYKPEQK